MSISFFDTKCQETTEKKRFGLCDDSHLAQNPAYLDEDDGAKWIAVVHNEKRYKVTFTAIDNCIDIKTATNKMAKRCDGALFYLSTVIFVELKERSSSGSEWVKDAEKQLRVVIDYFEDAKEAAEYRDKKAYIANSQRPKFNENQTRRMNQFFKDTGYILRIENRISLD
ncbi:MAG: hypothetical protein SF052_09590 [Bacteroidia bacterium]|nr:hypothetical protein [Bacteroidia bacterium]